MSDLLRTPLYDWHLSHHGRMVEFGGWEMPVQYASIVDEHHAVRRNVGMFDISHMGRLWFRGPEACSFLDRVLTNDVSRIKLGQVRYSLLCNPAGGILDDVLVYHLSDAYLVVVNASNRLKIWEWLGRHSADFQVELEDRTMQTAMIAIQGPKTSSALPGARAELWQKLTYYSLLEENLGSGDSPLLLSRTGYTGEDGCELIVRSEAADLVWRRILEDSANKLVDIRPCGLGARDTLRLEAAMPLYGHELSETIDPLTAGLEFAVKLDKPDFVGKAALLDIAQRTDRQVRVGLELTGRRIAREGCGIYIGNTRVGEVTSGTFSPTLERSIAMGYVSPAHSSPGTAIEIDVRGKRETASVVSLPFFKRPK